MEILKAYAHSFLGVPYKFGGNNPVSGIDCSGLVCELLRSVGLVRADMSAQELYDYFLTQGCIHSKTFGALVFFGESPAKITHVAMMLDGFRMIEAGGGDRLTVTREDAAARNAFVKVSMLSRRKDLIAILKPVYPSFSAVGEFVSPYDAA